MPVSLCFKLIGGDKTLLTLLCREVENNADVSLCALTNLTSHITNTVDINALTTVSFVTSVTPKTETHYLFLTLRNEAAYPSDAIIHYIVPAIHRLRSKLTCHRIE